jgi:hypothetical protein
MHPPRTRAGNLLDQCWTTKGKPTARPGEKTPGEPGHTRDTRDTRAHAGKRITRTNLTTIHPNPNKDTNPHEIENRDRLNSRKNSRKPGVDRSPHVPVKRHRREPVHTRHTGHTDTRQTSHKHPSSQPSRPTKRACVSCPWTVVEICTQQNSHKRTYTQSFSRCSVGRTTDRQE